MVLSIFFLASSPILIFVILHPVQFIKNIFTTLFGLHSWVGYHPVPGESLAALPRIRPGILTPAYKLERTDPDNQLIEKINMLYAKDYTVWNDLTILWSGFRYLGSLPNIIPDNPHGAN